MKNIYLTTHNTYKRYPRPWGDSNPQTQQASGQRPTPWTERPLEPVLSHLYVTQYKGQKGRFFVVVSKLTWTIKALWLGDIRLVEKYEYLRVEFAMAATSPTFPHVI